VVTLAEAATRLDSLRGADYSMQDLRGARIQSDWGDDPRLDGVRDAAMAAAAGRHHMLVRTDMPSRSGVDGIVRCIRSMLPRLDEDQTMDLVRIRDMKGVPGPFGIGLDDLPPLVDPFHLSSFVGMVGDRVLPGYASLANHGVLYLDEATEFSTRPLMGLTKPMDTGEVESTKTRGNPVRWPADFQLAGVMLRCPCGMPPASCRCTERDKARYHLPSPFEERCAIRIDSAAVRSRTAPGLAEARAMVTDARARQDARFAGTGIGSNNRIGTGWLEEHTSQDVLGLISDYAGTEEGRLALNTARLAWTMADLGGHESPDEDDALKALGMTMGDEAGREDSDHASSVCDPADALNLEQASPYGMTR